MIKSHHNVGGLPERMRMKLVEPLRELFKDEVRAVGASWGCDEEFVVPPAVSRARVWRCGSSARSTRSVWTCCAAPTRSYATRVKARRAGTHSLWQSFAVLLPVQSVGVMGDERTYEYRSRSARSKAETA